MPSNEQFRNAARMMYAEGSNNDIEVDDKATVLPAHEPGAGQWVAAWLWVDPEYMTTPNAEDGSEAT